MYGIGQRPTNMDSTHFKCIYHIYFYVYFTRVVHMPNDFIPFMVYIYG